MLRHLLIACLLIGLTGCATAQRQQVAAGVDMNTVKMVLKNPPLLGTTPAGQRIYLGGFSGLRFLGHASDGKLRFLTHTDRGPNTSEIEEGDKTIRPFLLPGFQPRIVYLIGDPEKGTLEVEREVLLRRPDGKKLSGIPQKAGQESPVDSTGKPIPLDPYGMDLEGIVQTTDGSFWMVEEYGPSVARFSSDGKLQETLKPGSGLPQVLSTRKLNRGFEGAALFGSRLYTVMQSPLRNGGAKKSRIVRIVEVDLLGRRTLGQFAYVIEGTKSDKIGDLAVLGPRNLLVIERDGKAGPGSFKRIYRTSLDRATNLQMLPERITGPGGTLESMSPEELAENGIIPAEKIEYVDLAAAGITEEKIEGIDPVNDRMLAVVVDNDFGLSGELDRATGKVGFKDELPAIYLLREPVWRQ